MPEFEQDVPFVGRVTVWPDFIDINTFGVAPASRSWDATPDEVEAVGRQFLAAAEWMRKASA